MIHHRFLPTSFMMWGGLLIWGTQFLSAYVIAALACARRFAHVQVFGINVVALTVLVISVAAIVATLMVMRYALRRGRMAADRGDHDPNDAFIRFVTMAVAGFALLAIILVALPPLLSGPGCQIR